MRAVVLIAAVAFASLSGPALAEHHDEIDTRNEAFASLPYWPGYWVSEEQAGTTITGLAPLITGSAASSFATPNFMALRGDSAPWNEEGQRRRAEMRAISGGRKATGWGYPMMMNSATPLRFLITPEETIIINFYNEARYIYTDGRAMPAVEDMWPTTYGTSVGHWDGDTLVIETVMVENPSVFFHGSPPFSEEARYVERIRLEGDRLINQVTVTDPVTITGSWSTTVAHVRDPGFDRQIILPWDNDRTGNEDGLNTIELAPVE
jgi:hypothetical protein